MPAHCRNRRRPVRTTVLAIVLLLAGSAAATPPGADFIPLAEINPGQEGYGLTVFEGSRIDTFGVRVIGVQDGVRAGGSLILIEVAGHGLEISSIAQGMSGSPIYLDGRFAGALAFGWGGALRPLAGVTPAAEMLALPTVRPGRRGLSGHGGGVGSRALLETIAPAGELAAELAAFLGTGNGSGSVSSGSPVGAGIAGSLPPGWPRPEAIFRPLLAGRLAAESAPGDWICRPLGQPAGPAAAGGTPRAAAAALQGGSACAVPLVLGDALLGAIGTVTCVDGDRVLMMGHPFLQRGPVDLPLATAEILTVFPSRELSFKMGSIGRVVGAVHHDQRAGLAGRLGADAPLVPVSVTIAAGGAAPAEGSPGDRRFSFEVVDDPLLTPALVFWSLYNSLLAESSDAGRQTLGYELETLWSGIDAGAETRLVFRGRVAGPGGARALAGEWMTPLAILLNNEFAPLKLRAVTASLETTPGLDEATIVGITGPTARPATGGPIVFEVEVDPRLGPRRTLPLTVDLPAYLAPGSYRVVAANAAEIFALEAQRAAGRFSPRSLSDVVAILDEERSADTLVLAVLARGEGFVLQGREMSDLPGSRRRTLRTGGAGAEATLADYVDRVEVSTDWVLRGHAVLELKVQPAEAPVLQERRP